MCSNVINPWGRMTNSTHSDYSFIQKSVDEKKFKYVLYLIKRGKNKLKTKNGEEVKNMDIKDTKENSFINMEWVRIFRLQCTWLRDAEFKVLPFFHVYLLLLCIYFSIYFIRLLKDRKGTNSLLFGCLLFFFCKLWLYFLSSIDDIYLRIFSSDALKKVTL